MGRMSDLDIERQEREGDDGGWGGPDDGAAMMKLERQEQHYNRMGLLAMALSRVIARVESSQPGQADVHCEIDSAATAFRLTSFERKVVLRAYDLDGHHGGRSDRRSLVDEAYDEITTEDDNAF